MDLDLEIINEKGHSPDPLFHSIINAMNSMKEATADKIYQKIQKEGATNYSKPQLALQVDRALASALRYGIFEVKNQRYRVRDDILDDVDTVYWKMQKKREQTPFRTQDGMNERHLGPKLDPEKDNLRFKNISNPEASECPQCGRIKRPLNDKKEEVKAKREKKEKNTKNTKDPVKSRKKRQIRKAKNCSDEEEIEEAWSELKRSRSERMLKSGSPADEKYFKMVEFSEFEASMPFGGRKLDFGNDTFMKPKKEFMPGGGKYDTTDESELDSLSFLSDDEQSFGSYQVKPKTKPQNTKPTCRFDSECDDIANNRGDNPISEVSTMDPKKSRETVKTESDSDMSSITNEDTRSHLDRAFDADFNIASKNSHFNDKNVFFAMKKVSGREVNDAGDDRNSGWISGFSDDHNGAVIVSNNMLTIGPTDSMSFKPSEHTSYIS